MSSNLHDKNRLFGVLAVRTGFVTSKVIAEAESDLAADKTASLGTILQHRGALVDESRKLLEELVESHLKLNSNDCEKSLATLDSAGAQLPSTSVRKPPANDETIEFDPAIRPLNDPFATSPLDGTPVDIDTTHWTPTVDPKQVGQRYLVLRAHAKGGMGQVSVAQDLELNREVAFKELQQYCADDSNSRARFVMEAEITGQLEHPGVVPIYGLGAYPDGRPFYAMRFVQGESLGQQINRFHAADESKLDLSQGGLEFRTLLGRFVDVCNAIAYAHSRGVLHRDIKPDNIMLGKYGETLVVDWGLAKAIGRGDSNLADETMIKATSGTGSKATRMGSATGTPAYMSPEQAAGQLNRLNTSSDVYSLGATLYCLLVGRAPIVGNSVTEVIKKAQHGDYETPKQVNPRIPTPLNSICCQAMSIEPADRYQTSLQLAADIERWLSDETVSAHQDSMREKSARWFRRHRTWAIAGTAASILVAAVAAFAAVQINQQKQKAIKLASDNQQLAIQERKAKQNEIKIVDTWMTGFSEALRYYPGVQKFREVALQHAAEDYERFVETEASDREMEIERGRTLLRLGDIRRELVLVTDAESAYNDAEAIFERFQNDEDGQSLPLVELPQALLRKAILAADLGESDQANNFYRRSIEAGNVILESNPNDKSAGIVVADATSRLAALLIAQGQVEKAEEMLRLSITKQQELVETSPDDLELLVSLANSRIVLGQLLFRLSSIEEARQEFENAINQFQRLISLDEDNPTYLDARAGALINLAMVHRIAGEWDLEAQVYRQAIVDYQRLIEAMPDLPVHRENLSLTQTDLGQLLRESFKPIEALKELESARTVIETLAAEHPLVIHYHERRATCLDNLGEVLLDLGRYSESLAVHKEAAGIFSELVINLPDILQYRERYAISRSHLGVVYHALQQFDLAETEFQAALESFEKASSELPDSDSALKSQAVASEYYGDMLHSAGGTEEACDAYANAKQYWTELIDRSPQADYYHRAAQFHVMCRCESIRDAKMAVQYASRALEAAPTNALYQGTLAATHYRDGNFALAVSLATESLRDAGGNRGRDYLFLGMAQHQLGQHSQAMESIAAADAWRSKNVPGNLILITLKDEAKQLLASADNDASTP